MPKLEIFDLKFNNIETVKNMSGENMQGNILASPVTQLGSLSTRIYTLSRLCLRIFYRSLKKK
jgi:hypothetical protein